MRIAISAETEAKLRRKAAEEGADIDAVANALLSHALDHAAPALEAERPRTAVPDGDGRPFRQDPRLTGVRFQEDPTAPLDPEDWPEAFE